MTNRTDFSDQASLARKYFVDAEPLALIYFVTKACNASCAHCFYWESLNKPRPRELTLKEIERIAQGLGKLLYLRLSGGEPFIRKDLFELVRIFSEKCRPAYIGIPTNGFYTERIASFVRKAASLNTRVEIGISIDDLAEHHDRIRGVKNLFNVAMASFNRVKKLKAESPNVGIGFIATAMKSNGDRLFELLDYLKRLKPDSIACNIVRDDTKIKEEKEVDQEVCRRFAQACDDYNNAAAPKRSDWFARMRNAKTARAHEIRARTIETNQFQIPCVAGNRIAVMYAEGEVHPCETLGYEIANIRDYDLDFKALLQSERAKTIREKIVKEHCFCTHECFTTASITFSKRELAKVATKAMVRA